MRYDDLRNIISIIQMRKPNLAFLWNNCVATNSSESKH